MASFNRVILMGNLTRDVEVKYLQSGTAVAEITLAVSDGRKDASGQWVEETGFYDCTLWGKAAENAAQYLGKGSPLLVEGKLRFDQWEKDGKKHSRVRVTVEKSQFVGGKGGGFSQAAKTEDEYPQTEAPARGRAKQAAGPESPVDDIPFAWIGLLLSLATIGSGFIS